MKLAKLNLHNHTTFSDGKNTPKDLVEKAINSGLDAVGITDHFEYFTGYHNKESNFHHYLQVINHLKAKYKDKIKVLAGLEIDLKLFQPNDFTFNQLKDLDIILFERVYTFEDLMNIVEHRDKFPNIVGLAHPDFNEFRNTERLIHILEQNNLFVELNTSRFEYLTSEGKSSSQPRLHFEVYENVYKEIKDRKITLTVGVDVHSLRDQVGDISTAYNFIKKLKLKKNLLNLP